jgi:hypothetical protein
VIPVSRPNAKIAAAGTLGFASALLFVFLTGTLAGWFSELGISMTMIGLLSSITLAYAFKLLQAPLVQRRLHCWIVLSCSGLCGSGAEAELSDDEYERQSAKDRKRAILDKLSCEVIRLARVRCANPGILYEERHPAALRMRRMIL